MEYIFLSIYIKKYPIWHSLHSSSCCLILLRMRIIAKAKNTIQGGTTKCRRRGGGGGGEERKSWRGKLFHQLSFAARVTHCGSNAPTHSSRGCYRGMEEGEGQRGAYAIFCSKFCGKTPYYFTANVSSAFGMRCGICWVSRPAGYHHSHWGIYHV